MGLKSTPQERILNLRENYGSFASMARSIAPRLGISESTAARYLSEIGRGDRDASKSIMDAVSRRERYFSYEVPRREVSKILDPEDKIDKALEKGWEIRSSELLPPNFTMYGHQLPELLKNDPRFVWVREALAADLTVVFSVTYTDKDGNVTKETFRVSGDDDSIVSKMYEIFRAGISRGGSNVIIEMNI